MITRPAKLILGHHHLLELHGCDATLLAHAARMEQLLYDTAVQSGITVVARTSHAFHPHGVSCVLIVAESHIALHTWPEHAFASLDFFSCNLGLDVQPFLQRMAAALHAQSQSYKMVERG
jgi:S-adenosylmethionine decarboxylase proenzyme